MGTTVSSLQVFLPGSEAEAVQQAVEQALQNIFTQQGYQVSDEAPHSIRAYYVVVREDCDWISIFNRDTSGQATSDFFSELQQLGAPLSATLGQPVVSVELFDEDALWLRLYEQGALIDTISNWDNYDATPRQRTGDTAKWASVLPPDVTIEDLQDIWDVSALAETDPASAPDESDQEDKFNQQFDQALAMLKNSPLAGLLGGLTPDIEDMARQQVRQIVENADAFDANDLLSDIADLLGMESDLVYSTGEDFAEVEDEATDEDLEEAEESDLLISILYLQQV